MTNVAWPGHPMTDEELVAYVRSRYSVGPRGENGLLHDLADRIEYRATRLRAAEAVCEAEVEFRATRSAEAAIEATRRRNRALDEWKAVRDG